MIPGHSDDTFGAGTGVSRKALRTQQVQQFCTTSATSENCRSWSRHFHASLQFEDFGKTESAIQLDSARNSSLRHALRELPSDHESMETPHQQFP